MAAEAVLRRISRPTEETNRPWEQIVVKPELVVRGTSSPVLRLQKAL
jgi:DNA-binding LacI/PurR family transcriptional regulator